MRPRLFICGSGVLVAALLFGQGPSAPLGDFEGRGDVGTVLHPGSAQYHPESIYTITGSGEHVGRGGGQSQRVSATRTETATLQHHRDDHGHFHGSQSQLRRSGTFGGAELDLRRKISDLQRQRPHPAHSGGRRQARDDRYGIRHPGQQRSRHFSGWDHAGDQRPITE
jgi:hypothetical protein